MNDETLTVEEAAAFLHVHPDTVKARARAGELIGYKPGRKWVFLRSDLFDYLKSTKYVAGPHIRRPKIYSLDAQAAIRELDKRLGPVKEKPLR